MELLISVFLAYRNSLLARQKGQNTIVWVFITIIAFFIAQVAGGILLLLIYYKGAYTEEGIRKFMINPLHYATMLFAGFGGYLLIRYILDRMPDNNKTEG